MRQRPRAPRRDARLRAGLSQVELGRRAGVTQSVVSAYEAGARQPSLLTLARLVRAAGFDLDITLHEAQPREERGADPLGQVLAGHRLRVRAIAQRYGLTNVRVFGSVARGEETPQSDIDLLVDVAAGVGLVGLARCQRDLEKLLDARVDLVPASSLKEGVAHSVLTEARPL